MNGSKGDQSADATVQQSFKSPEAKIRKCECCPVAWGKYTGWHYDDDADPCEHVDEQEVLS